LVYTSRGIGHGYIDDGDVWIELANDPMYLKNRIKLGIDNNIGFNPNCINYNYGNSKEFVTLSENSNPKEISPIN
jgi:hypothetical protein